MHAACNKAGAMTATEAAANARAVVQAQPPHPRLDAVVEGLGGPLDGALEAAPAEASKRRAHLNGVSDRVAFEGRVENWSVQGCEGHGRW